MGEVTFLAALLAGLLSFLSPCVLPLVPPYLAYMAGTSVAALAAPAGGVAGGGAAAATAPVSAARMLPVALGFVLGFGTVFVLLGAGASAAGHLLRVHADTLAIVAGVAIIAMGLHFLGIFRLAFLYREARLTVDKPAGMLGAYAMGLAFAFGWTPCIGPVLASVLAVAGAEASVTRGMALLAAYSAGLGIPFLLAALAMVRFMGLMRALRQHMATIEKVMGALLVLTGIAFLTGGMATAAFWLLETFPALGRLG